MMNSIFKLHRTIFHCLRPNVRYSHVKLLPITSGAVRLVVIGNGAKSVGKSAVLFANPSNFVINIPEAVVILLGFLGVSTDFSNVLLTRRHWNNVGGLSSFQFHFEEMKEKLKIFGIDNLKIHSELPKGIGSFQSLPKPVEGSRHYLKAFHLSGGDDCDETIAYHILLRNFRKLSEHSWENYLNENGKVFSLLVLEVLNEEQIQSFASNLDIRESLASHPPDMVLHFSDRQMQQLPAFRDLVASFPATCQHLFLDGEQPSYFEPCWMRRIVVRHFFENRRVYPLPPILKSSLSKAEPDKAWQNLTSDDWQRLSVHFEEMRSWMIDKGLGQSMLKKFPAGLDRGESTLLSPCDLQAAPIGLPNCWSGHSMLSYHFLAKQWSDGLDRSLDAAPLLASILASNFQCELNQVRQKAEAIGKKIEEDVENGTLPRIRNEFPKVIFIGTGSAFPILQRGVTSILIRVDAHSSVLLDCGVGTVARMHSFFGSEGMHEIMKTLKMVCVTHDHLDHIEGLPSLMMEWTKVNSASETPPLVMMANPGTFDHLFNHVKQFCPSLDLTRFYDVMLTKPQMMSRSPIPGLKLEIVRAWHRYRAFGFSLRHRDGWHILFSGDTMPSKDMILAGKGCDLLIHEATHEDEHWKRAKKAKHSTIGQAIDVACEMEAQRVVLTHFSQSLGRFPFSKNQLPDRFALASDGMQLTFDDMDYFRGEQIKTLANSILHSFTYGSYQFFSETPKFFKPPRLQDEEPCDKKKWIA